MSQLISYTYDPTFQKVVPKGALVIELTAHPQYTADLIRKFTQRHGGGAILNCIADQIVAQTKPPRIPEPVGFDAAVEAHTHQPLTGSTRRRFVRIHDREGGYSWVDRTGEHRPWGELLDPVLLRNGSTVA